MKNLVLSLCGATTGVVVPIAFSYLLLYLGFGFGKSANRLELFSAYNAC